MCVCRRRDRRTHDEVGGARSARRLARGSALARQASPVSALTEPSRRCNVGNAVMSLDTRRTRHESACACVDFAIGARATKAAALGQHDDSLAARRSLGGLCRCRLRQSRAGDATQRRGDVTRHTAHTTRRVRVRVSTARSARRRKGRRRSVGTTTRSRFGARSALPVSALLKSRAGSETRVTFCGVCGSPAHGHPVALVA